MEIVIDGPVLVLGGDFDVRSTFQVRNALYDLLAAYDVRRGRAATSPSVTAARRPAGCST